MRWLGCVCTADHKTVPPFLRSTYAVSYVWCSMEPMPLHPASSAWPKGRHARRMGPRGRRDTCRSGCSNGLCRIEKVLTWRNVENLTVITFCCIKKASKTSGPIVLGAHVVSSRHRLQLGISCCFVKTKGFFFLFHTRLREVMDVRLRSEPTMPRNTGITRIPCNHRLRWSCTLRCNIRPFLHPHVPSISSTILE